MATSIEFVDKQWDEWLEKNPTDSFTHIDTEELKESLIKDLEYASKMDVREYTLYQKWCEVQEKYPTKNVNTLFGDILVSVVDSPVFKDLEKTLESLAKVFNDNKGLIKIEDYLQNNPPPQEILQNNSRNINSIDFYLPNFEDEPFNSSFNVGIDFIIPATLDRVSG